MSGAGVMAALLSLGLGFAVETDAYADADNVQAATSTTVVGRRSFGERGNHRSLLGREG